MSDALLQSIQVHGSRGAMQLNASLLTIQPAPFSSFTGAESWGEAVSAKRHDVKYRSEICTEKHSKTELLETITTTRKMDKTSLNQALGSFAIFLYFQKLNLMSMNACYQRKPNKDPNPSKWPWTHRGWWCDHRPHLRHQRASKPQGPSIPIAPRGDWCVSFKMSKRMTYVPE